MILIGQYDSPFVRRVAVALQHYEMQYEHRPWSVWAQADEIARYNPLRRVPVFLLDSGEVLLESAAILDAMDEMSPSERRLIAGSGPERRAVLRVCALATGLADKAVTLLYEMVLRKEEARSKVWVIRATQQIQETLNWLEGERARTSGDLWFGHLTHADIATACALRFLREAHPEMWAASRHPSLTTLTERCERMPIFQRVVQPLSVAVKPG